MTQSMINQEDIDLNAFARNRNIRISSHFDTKNDATLFRGDRLDMLRELPDGAAQLVVTSPPYNIGKEYEKIRSIEDYLLDQDATIREAVRALADNGSLCWQVGNHITRDGEVLPLDIPMHAICKKYGLKMRNRIIWHFEHGLHCTKRFSGRYETIVWFTKTDEYIFDLDPVRVPQKYPGKKNFKGDKAGSFSCNPKGKNPSDLWIIPNVKHNHCEKTNHPCQFPIELIERLVLAMTEKGGLVVDPYMGVGSALCAAIRRGRKAAGAEIKDEYTNVAHERVLAAWNGTLRVRPMGKPVYTPDKNSKVAMHPDLHPESNAQDGKESKLF